MKWRPIKSAPRDCLVLLSCNEHPEYPPYVCVGRWIDVPHFNEVMWLHNRDQRLSPDIKTRDDLDATAKVVGHWSDGYPAILRDGDGRQCYELRGGILFHPTHWMPLPNPPKPRRRRTSPRK